MPVPQETLSKIFQLKQRIADEIQNFPVYDSDFYLYYWLKGEANGMSVPKAETMLRKTISWRKEILEPPMPNEEFEMMVRETNIKVFFSPDGSASVGFDCFLATDIGRLIAKYGPKLYKFSATICQRSETFLMNGIKNARSLDEQLRTRPRNMYLVDFSLLSLRRVSSPAVTSVLCGISTTPSTHFPGLITSVYFANVGTWTGFIAKMLLPLISGPGTKAKACGVKDEEWKVALFEHLKPEDIPEHFGGKRSWPIAR